jgi:glycosyltransferase involved in cell wall biosynthesis
VTVNIIVKGGWILERCAREIKTRVATVSINNGHATQRVIAPSAGAHYYMPAKDIRKYPVPHGYRVGFFTHGADSVALAPQFDACIAMNEAMATAVRAAGGRAVRVIRPGTDLRKPVVFGVVGRVYNNGRKGADLVRAVIGAGHRVVACGAVKSDLQCLTAGQWPCAVTHTTDQRAAFYKSIDYLLVPSIDEGGPMPVVDALAMGVPVIAPDVGWCWEFPVIRYERGNTASLLAVMRGLTQTPTWAAWAKAHADVFASLAQSEAVAC